MIFFNKLQFNDYIGILYQQLFKTLLDRSFLGRSVT